MNEALKDLNIKQLQYYFRTKSDTEHSPFQAIQNNKVIQLIHSLVLEIEKPGSYYNKFKNEYTLEIYLFNEETMKMDMIKAIPFDKLHQTEQKGA